MADPITLVDEVLDLAEDVAAARVAAAAADNAERYRHAGSVYTSRAALRARLTALLGSAEPVAHFLDTAAPGQPAHYEQIAAEHADDPDAIPLYTSPASWQAERERYREVVEGLLGEMKSGTPDLNVLMKARALLKESDHGRRAVGCGQ